MIRKSLVAAGLVVGSCILGFAGQAEAASIIKKFSVTQYDNSQHAFWFDGLYNQKLADGQRLAAHKDFFFDEPGEMNIYDDGTASLTGIISNKVNSEQKWDVNIKFNTIKDYNGGLKNPQSNTGVSNDYAYAKWDFWEFDSSSVLTGLGEYEGSEIFLHNRAFDEANLADFQATGKDPKVVGQQGLGANDKNGDLGFSAWFGYTGTVEYKGQTKEYTSYSHKNWTKSDINLQITQVPEPATMSLVSLGIIGLGASALKRKQS